jgi:hypothetical protein
MNILEIYVSGQCMRVCLFACAGPLVLVHSTLKMHHRFRAQLIAIRKDHGAQDGRAQMYFAAKSRAQYLVELPLQFKLKFKFLLNETERTNKIM